MCKEHILVVEDDIDINNLITKKLEKHKYTVSKGEEYIKTVWGIGFKLNNN